MHSIVKSWPLRGWAIDVIGKIYPASCKQYCFILMATDYFTKCAKAIPLKVVNQQAVIKFIKKNLIHRFNLLESITTYKGKMFTGKEMIEFAKEYRFKLIHSTPYYVKANDQAEVTNKALILNI